LLDAAVRASVLMACSRCVNRLRGITTRLNALGYGGGTFRTTPHGALLYEKTDWHPVL